jgi:hypothetical protein
MYEISNEYVYDDASDWVKRHVIQPMYEELSPAEKRKWGISDFHKYTGKSTKQIAKVIEEFVMLPFIGSNKKKDIEFYAYYGDYDWVVLCSLFGTMMDLPKHFPKFCFDLKQTMEDNGLSVRWKQEHCPDPVGAHNALVDARWNYALFQTIKKERGK